ncbi:zinc metalloprotease [Actinocorallia populi]|uniref:zinc metalloprotease n=1 Tax=Actinocorallia populi TaxID=2079200 RepID=UPI000D0961E2|nr:zinc metalloprotease [Actinocorallia populi]
MKRAGKYAVLGLAAAAAVSVPRIAQAPEPVVALPPDRTEICVTGQDPHAHAGHADHADHSQARVRAGSRVAEPGSRVSPRVAEQVERELDRQEITGRLLRGTGDRKRIHVPVHFHVLHDGRKGKITKKAVNEQIKVLDAAYRGAAGGADAGINFYLKKITWTKNKGWFKQPRRYETAFKKKLRKGGDSTLNIYTAELGTELLGWASMPWDYRKSPKQDGVVVHHASLPGGKIKDYDLGYTAVHEVGHWLGLYHTFGRDYPERDGCAAGDLVGDTPSQKEPTNGCPENAPDSCPAWGRDPIHNFMDYGYDRCMTEFTEGQVERMRNAWERYRP